MKKEIEKLIADMIRDSGDQVKELCTPDEMAFMSCAAFGEHRMVMTMYGNGDNIGPMLSSLMVNTVRRAGLDESFLYAVLATALAVLKEDKRKGAVQ